MPDAIYEKWSDRCGEIGQDVKLKLALQSLESENSRLKTLVIRLSETIIRSVTAKG
jgi:hypothetical protein